MIHGLFFFNDTATTEIYTFPYTTLFRSVRGRADRPVRLRRPHLQGRPAAHHRHPVDLLDAAGQRRRGRQRSEEHTSELQSRQYLVCRLLLEKYNEDHFYVTLPPVPSVST